MGHPSTSDQQRAVVAAFFALHSHLPVVGWDAAETQEAFMALRRAYQGPSSGLLEGFSAIRSLEDAARWLSSTRQTLEQEIDDQAVWVEAGAGVRHVNGR